MEAETERRVKLAIAVVLIVGAIWYLQNGNAYVPPQQGRGGGVFGNNSNANLKFGPAVGDLAPEFVAGGQWFNSPPLKMSGLRGKVVLVDFWTYTCINCLRTLPYVKSWDEKYADKGLVIVGVHTPEFNFERDPANVKQAVDDQGIKYAVMQDNDYGTWKAWQNNYWPRKFLVDKDGVVRYDHIGEGGYADTEAEIIKLLGEAGANVSENIQLPNVTPEHLQATTPETYAGYWRAGALGNAEGYQPDNAYDYGEPENVQLDKFYLRGRWTMKSQYVEYSGAPEKGYVALAYYAMSVNAVMRPASGSGSGHAYNATVLLDAKPISRENAGRDVKFDAAGTPYVQVDEDRLYNVVRTPGYGAHTLQLVTSSNEFSLYAYTFG